MTIRPVAQTPIALRPRPRKTSPSPHAAWTRGRLARLGILAPPDAARYLDTCDERAAMAYALGAEYDGPGVACPSTVEAMVDEAMGATVARVACGSSSLRIDLGASLDRMPADERDSVTASVGLSVADAAREGAGDVLTEARASGFGVRLAVPQRDRARMAAHLHDVARTCYVVAEALLGREAGAEAPAEDGARPVSARVLKLLDDLGVPLEAYRSSSNTAHVVAARRAVVLSLGAEGLSTMQIVDETGLSKATVHAHRAAGAR